MKKVVFFVLQLAVFSLMTGCSGSDDKQSVEEKQEQLGHEAAEAIKEPMEKAADIQAIVDKHYAEKEEESQ